MVTKLILLALTALAAWYDVRFRRIPNWLSILGCVAGLTYNAALAGFSGLRFASLGLALGFALYFPLWLMAARGAGDVKLLAAAGSLLGPYNTLVLAGIAAIVGGILAIILVIQKGATVQTASNIRDILSSLIRLRRPTHTLATPGALRLPHGLVILLAATILSGTQNL